MITLLFYKKKMNNNKTRFLFIVINCFPIKSFTQRINLHHILAMFLKSSKMLSKESFSFAVYLKASGESCYWIFSSNKKYIFFKIRRSKSNNPTLASISLSACQAEWLECIVCWHAGGGGGGGEMSTQHNWNSI